MSKPADTKQSAPASPTQTPATPSQGDHKKFATAAPRGKTLEVVEGKCHAGGCKHNSSRFNFCDQHYDHFKFGLIKKNGQPVPDYEKKIEHYEASKAKSMARKAA